MSLLYHNSLKMATLIDMAYQDRELSPDFRRCMVKMRNQCWKHWSLWRQHDKKLNQVRLR